jgi:pimeloyl-ACP methyl ester carboxylesterase
MNKNPPIILLSGMGADARVFAKQIEAIPQIVVPPWIAPLPRESLSSYAERLASTINPGEPCFIGGASFGGFVALEMIRHMDVLGCFLIGSVRSPKEFPQHFNLLKRASCATDVLPFEIASLLSKAFLMSSGALTSSHVTELLKQMSDSDASFLRWACRAVLEWEGVNDTGAVPIYHIHGDKDFVLPVANTHPDVIVAGGGHALSLSHPDEVTRFLKDRINK